MSDSPKFKTFRDLRSVPKKEEKADTSISSISSISSNSSLSSTSSSSSSSSKPDYKKHQTEVSPVRDFQKIPNSIPRNLDLFRGKSKQVLDYLWSVSRGAINPSRTVRKSRKEIKEKTKLGSMVTVDAAIEHLVNVGLLKVVPNVGSLGGNEYEIFTPEEIHQRTTSISSIPSISSITSLTQKVDDLDIPESSTTSITQDVENKDIYSVANTSFKTNTKNDDEAFAPFIEKFQKVCERLTGKQVTKRDADKLSDLADLLILELEIAARRTNSISNVPAFLTEVLRRQFFASRQQQSVSNKTLKVKKDTVGKSDSESYEIKPLDQKGREEALAQLREFVGDDFLQDFKKWYTTEDWQWLMKQLRID